MTMTRLRNLFIMLPLLSNVVVTQAQGECEDIPASSWKWVENVPNYDLPQLGGIFFLDDQTGWVTRRAHHTAYPNMPGVFKTVDGGASWVNIDVALFGSQVPNLLFFVSEQIGWAAHSGSSRLYKTIDGGLSWEGQSENAMHPGSGYGFFGHELEDMFFINETHGWVVTIYGLWYTEDGGESWYNYIYEQTSSSLGNWGDLLGVSGFLSRSVYFLNEEIGYVSGNIGGGFAGQGAIIKTIDGGNTWDVIFQSVNIESERLSDIYFYDENFGWAVGTSEFNGIIYHTNDAGNTWTEQQVENIDPLPFLNYPNSLQHVHFQNEEIGWAVGLQTSLFTCDGGETWTYHPTANTGSGTVPILSFSANEFGKIVGAASHRVMEFSLGILPDAPELVSPSNSANNVGLPVEFVWHSVEHAESYQLEIAYSSSDSEPVYDNDLIDDTTHTVLGLTPDNTFHVWRVRGINEYGDVGEWSSWRSFTTGEDANTSTVDMTDDKTVSVYPNPFTESFTVMLPEDVGAFSLHLTDMQGRTVMQQQNITSSPHTITLPQLTPGVYVLESQTERGKHRQRLVKMQ